MARHARLRKVGGSVMLAIPRPMMEALDLAPDASVELSINSGKLVVDPQKRRRYTLVLAQCKPPRRRAMVNVRGPLERRPDAS
jgi:antitoxin component of MazEF toxin-antitoxin module